MSGEQRNKQGRIGCHSKRRRRRKLIKMDGDKEELSGIMAADHPSMVDGLTRGERKILFCAFERNLVNEELDLPPFMYYVLQHSRFHHVNNVGNTILSMVMTQDYVGSDNNLNLLKPNRFLGPWVHDHIFIQLSPITRRLFPEDDDILLHYHKEEGQSIEPTWYAPVIPTVLVNGSHGTSIPKYKPSDIVLNIRRLLNDEPPEPMCPWYKGFNGTIEKISEDCGVSYIAKGIIVKIDETTLHITGLPIGQFVGDYYDFLKSLVIGNDKVKDVSQYYYDATTLHFQVTLSKESMAIAEREGLFHVFQLITKISTSNILMLNSEAKITKYDTPEKILQDFYHLRLGLYEERKRVVTANLELELLKLQEQITYLKMLKVRKFSIFGIEGDVTTLKTQAEIVEELSSLGFKPFPEKTKAAKPVVAVASKGADDNSEIVGSEGARFSDYTYLLKVNVTRDVTKLCEKQVEMTAKLEEMKKSTAKCLWRKDLDALVVALQDQERLDDERKQIAEWLQRPAMETGES